jgi:hypothetical protein
VDEFTGKRQPRRLLERHDGSMIRMTKRVAAAAARIASAGGRMRSVPARCIRRLPNFSS